MSDEFVNLDNARKEHQIEVMKKIITDEVCPFCEENFLTYHTKPVMFKTDNWIITENAWPYDLTKNHILCVYRKHITHTKDIDAEGWQEIGVIIARLEKEQGLECGTLLMRFGNTKKTGASVSHIHLQLIQSDKDHPDYKPEEGLKTRIG